MIRGIGARRRLYIQVDRGTLPRWNGAALAEDSSRSAQIYHLITKWGLRRCGTLASRINPRKSASVEAFPSDVETETCAAPVSVPQQNNTEMLSTSDLP